MESMEYYNLNHKDMGMADKADSKGMVGSYIQIQGLELIMLLWQDHLRSLVLIQNQVFQNQIQGVYVDNHLSKQILLLFFDIN